MTAKMGRVLLKFRLNRRYFLRLLYLGLFAVFIPLLVSSVLSYWMMSASLEQQVKQASMQTLEQMRQRLDTSLYEAEQATTSLLFDNDIVHAAYRTDLQQDIISLFELNKKINLVKQTIPKAYSVELYLPRQRLSLSTAFGYRSGDEMERTDAFFRTLDFAGGTVWTFSRQPVSPGTTGNEGPLIYFVRPFPLFAATAQGYIAIAFPEADFFHYLQAGGNTIVIDANRRIVSHPDKALIGTTFRTTERWGEKAAGGETLGSFTDRAHGVIVSFSRSAYNGWTIVNEIQGNDLFSYRSKIIGFTLLVGCLSSLIGVMLTVLNSRRLYAPLSELLNRQHKLERGLAGTGTGDDAESGTLDEWGYIRNNWSQLESRIASFTAQNAGVLREMFLSRLLYHYYANEPTAEIVRHCELHRIRPQGAFKVIVAEPERFDADGRFGERDKQLILFAIANIAKDVLSAREVDGEAVVLADAARVAVVLTFPSDAEPSAVYAEAHEAGDAIRAAVEAHLKFAVSIGIGGTRAFIGELGKSYDEAQEALRYRLVKGGNRTIDIGDVTPYHGAYTYPLEQEQALVMAVRQGQLQDVLERFAEFAAVCTQEGYSASLVRQTYVHLFLALSRISHEGADDLVQMNAMDTLLACRTSGEAEGWFRTRFLPFLVDRISAEQATAGKQGIDMAIAYMEEHLADDLSLTAVAERAGLNASYFSRLFVQHKGINFGDYVARLRTEEAKRLLTETDWTVTAIAERIGYTEPTFRRVFKQVEGVTPNAYRAANRQ